MMKACDSCNCPINPQSMNFYIVEDTLNAATLFICSPSCLLDLAEELVVEEHIDGADGTTFPSENPFQDE